MDTPTTPSLEERPIVNDEREIRTDIQVRTKMIYPQKKYTQGTSSQFRFPIIPDEIETEIERDNPPKK